MAFKIPKPVYDARLVEDIEEHLCQNYYTAIVQTLGPDSNGLLTHYTLGADTKTYSRPMFQLFKDGASSSFPVNYTPCPDCDDFAYTSNCETHYELGWDPKRHDFNIRQPQPEPTVVASPSGRPLFTAETLQAPHPAVDEPFTLHTTRTPSGDITFSPDTIAGFQPPEGMYQRLMELFGRPLNLHSDPPPIDAYRRMLTDEERTQDRVARLPDATLRIDGIFGEGTIIWEFDDGGA